MFLLGSLDPNMYGLGFLKLQRTMQSSENLYYDSVLWDMQNFQVTIDPDIEFSKKAEHNLDFLMGFGQRLQGKVWHCLMHPY